MRRVTAVLSAAAIVLSTTIGVMAQAKPDFSGTWTLVPGEGGGGGGRGGRGGGGGGWGANPTIKQSGNTLTVTYTGGRRGGEGQAMTLTYDLSGKPTTRTMMGRGGGGEQQVTDTATWSGSSLVIVTKTPQAEQRRTISLKDGNLVIEYNSGREGATPQTITYKKG
jgi:hypothetical protein